MDKKVEELKPNNSMANSTLFSDQIPTNFFDISCDIDKLSSSSSLGFTELLGFQDYNYSYGGSASSSSAIFDFPYLTSSIVSQPSISMAIHQQSLSSPHSSITIPAETTSEVLNNSINSTTPNTPNSSGSVSSSSNELAAQNDEQSKPQQGAEETEIDNQEKTHKQ